MTSSAHHEDPDPLQAMEKLSEIPQGKTFSDFRALNRTLTKKASEGTSEKIEVPATPSNLTLDASEPETKFKEVTEDGGIALEFDIKESMLDSIYESHSLKDDPQPTQAMLQRNLSIRFPGTSDKMKPLNVVMLVVGTRGDVQPFIGIGLKMQKFGHRVRIASHSVYRDFVTSFGLEFYPLGGDPKVLSEFVVKNRGIIPNSINNIGDALGQTEQIKQILYSSYDACVKADPEHPDEPFMAEAIIANPPAYGHTHCAEKLKVPLHIVFTMPWTPTKYFASPFARIATMVPDGTSTREVMNYLSYFGVENVAWLGQSGLITEFRKKVLGLTSWDDKQNGAHAIFYTKTPFTYIWSPALVDRPADWPDYCKVVGFINVELKKLTQYTPPSDLQAFLDAGDPPIYIGFGSLVVDDPVQLTRDFLEAIKATGLRAIIQRGWGGLGAGVEGEVEDVLFIDSAPHDWLFEKCCAVVHHGGAGTTATGLYAGKPTFIVPFFGDQPFWGEACFNAGVGPAPIRVDDLTSELIVNALMTLTTPKCRKEAKIMQAKMMKEDGTTETVDHIHTTIYGQKVPDTPKKSGVSSLSNIDEGTDSDVKLARAMTNSISKKSRPVNYKSLAAKAAAVITLFGLYVVSGDAVQHTVVALLLAFVFFSSSSKALPWGKRSST